MRHLFIRLSASRFTAPVLLLSLLVTWSLVHAQPYSDQDWNTNIALVNDALTVQCAEFVLPQDVLRELQGDTTTTEGEFAESNRAAHENKITLQPQSGTSDTLSTISGCAIDGAKLFLSTHDAGDTITINNAGNIVTPDGSDVVLSTPNVIVELVLRGASFYFVGSPSGGGGGGCGNLDGCFNAGNVIDGANETKPVIFANDPAFNASTDSHHQFYVHSTSREAIWHPKCDGLDCDIKNEIQPSMQWSLSGSGLFETVAHDGTHTYAGARRPLVSIEWSGLSLSGDGANCDQDPTINIVNSTPHWGIRCPMTGTNVDGFVYGVGITLPENFDPEGDFVASIKTDLYGTPATGSWHGIMDIDCVGDGESRGTFTGAVNLDVTAEGGQETFDVAVSKVDAGVAGADCQPGDTIYPRWRSCDTGSPTTGCTSSAGLEDDMAVTSIRLQFLINSDTQ